MNRKALRRPPEQTTTAAPRTPADRTDGVVRLQQAIGNRAVATLLRQPKTPTKAKPTKARPPDKIRGDAPPAKPDDSGAAARVAERTRSALERDIDDSFQHIETLTEHRIDAWKTNTEIPDDKPDNKILEIVIAILAEGLGGVVYGVIDHMLAEDKATHHLIREFLDLAGLEAGDLAAEEFFRRSFISARDMMQLGNVNARTESQYDEAITGALKKGTNPVDVYVEVAKNHALDIQVQGQQGFNKKAPTMSDQELLGVSAAQTVIYRKLAKMPELFQRELTVGWLRMLEELDLKFEHDDASETNMWGAWPSPGEVTLVGSPTYESYKPPKERTLGAAHAWNLGSWAAPDFSFDGFEAHAKIVNAATLENLTGAKADEVGLTEIFYFMAKNPYTGFMEGAQVYIIFRRDAGGRFRVARMGSENAYEWLTSYYTREERDHTENEQDKYAPLGAEKLYDHVKDKVIKSTQIV